MKQYICVLPFVIEMVDDDGRYTENFITIDEGSRWNLSESAERFCGNNDTVRLESAAVNDLMWIEILPERLQQNFREAQDET